MTIDYTGLYYTTIDYAPRPLLSELEANDAGIHKLTVAAALVHSRHSHSQSIVHSQGGVEVSLEGHVVLSGLAASTPRGSKS